MIALNVLLRDQNLPNVIFLFILSSATSFLITFFSIPFIIDLAQKYGLVDRPDGNIKTHKTPVAYLGGLAVLAGFLTSFILWMPVDARLCFLILGCILLLLLGLADDLMALKPGTKFLGQFIIAASFIRAGFYLKESFFSEIWTIPLSLLWLLTCMNAINLIDVMDGLAASTCLLAAASFALFAILQADIVTAQALAILIGSLAAFFYYNKPQARIYLGDTGSLFLGGFLGVIPLLLSWSETVEWGFLVPPLLLAVPLWEIQGLIIIRLLKGISVHRGSKDHFCHYLGARGWGRKQILFLSALFAIICTSLAYFALQGALPLMLFILLCATVYFFWTIFIWKVFLTKWL